jgi:general stress protein 26
MADTSDRAANIAKLNELIKDVEYAMLTTAFPDGSIHSRPMATQKVDFDGDLWFFTRASSHKVLEIEREHHVNVSYASPDQQRYVSVSGMANLVRDRAKLQDLWNPVYKAWFPQGLDDPDLALIKVTAEQAEYWDSPSSLVAHVISFLKSMATGQSSPPGEHGKVKL